MSTLTGRRIKDTYENILHIEGGITVTPTVVEDGAGNDSILSLSSASVDVNGDLKLVNGSFNTILKTSPSASGSQTIYFPTSIGAVGELLLVSSVGSGIAQLSYSKINTTNFLTNIFDTDTTLAANSSTRIPSQSAVKGYVDNYLTGLRWKQSVKTATTASGTLASSFQNGSNVGGVTVSTSDRILIKNQSSQTENGIYTVNASGAPTRATDADTGAELISATVMVEQGTNADTQWTCSNDSITIGSTSIVFAQIAGAGTYSVNSGTGLSLSGNQFSISTVPIANGGTNSSSFNTASGLVFFDSGTTSLKSSDIITDGTNKLAIGTTGTWVDMEQVRIKGAPLNINPPTDAIISASFTQPTGYLAEGYTNSYKIYSYKTINGTIYYSLEETASISDSSEEVSIGAGVNLAHIQNFMFSGYTDGTYTNNYYVIPYINCQGGQAIGSASSASVLIEGNTAGNYRVDLSWDAVTGASGYYLVSVYDVSERWLDAGDNLTFIDDNSNWMAGSFPYTTPFNVPDNYVVNLSWSAASGVDGYLVTISSTASGYAYDYYKDVGVSTSLGDDSTGWNPSPPDVLVNEYPDKSCLLEGDVEVIGTLTSSQISANVATITTATITGGTFSGLFNGTYDTTVPIGKGGTNNISFTTNRLTYYSGSQIASTTQNTYVNSGSGIIHNQFTASAATNKPLVLKGAASQSAALLEMQNSSGTALSSITPTAFRAVDGSGSAPGYSFQSNSTVGMFYSYQEIYIKDGFSGQYRFGDNKLAIQSNSAAIRLGAADGYLSLRLNSLYGNGLEVTNGPNYGDALGPILCGSGSTTQVALIAKLAASATANAFEVRDSGGTVLTNIYSGGGLKPASMADASAPNDSIYYSTTASKLVYKDSGGTVNNLY